MNNLFLIHHSLNMKVKLGNIEFRMIEFIMPNECDEFEKELAKLKKRKNIRYYVIQGEMKEYGLIQGKMKEHRP